MSHTPGPWEAVPSGAICAGGTLIATAHCPVTGDRGQGREANSRLIAAAPDLLEALIDLLDCISETSGKRVHDAQTKALAAIAKSEGRS